MKKNNRLFFLVLASIMSISLFTGCKPSIPEDTDVETSHKTEVTDTAKKDSERNVSEEKIPETEENGVFAAPIGTNGDNDNMNSPLDVSLTINYGTGGQFYDAEAIYGYLKNKDTLIFDSPMYELICEYIENRETDRISVYDDLAICACAYNYDENQVKDKYKDILLNTFPNIEADSIIDRLFNTGAAEYFRNYIQINSDGSYLVKNEEAVFAAIYKTVANYYNAKYFGTNFSAGTSTFEGDPELVYKYTKQNGGVVKSMTNTMDEPGFEMSVDTYNGPFIIVTTKYKLVGEKEGLYQSFDRTDTFFVMPVLEDGNVTFKVDFMISPTDYIYAFVENPQYDEDMKLIAKKVNINEDDNCVYFSEN